MIDKKKRHAEKTSQSKGDQMLRRIKSFATLRQWRDEYLGLSQRQVAILARLNPGRICRVEKGDLPKSKRCWRPYMKAYQLDNYMAEFERLARAGGAA